MTATTANKPQNAHQTMLAKLLAKENIRVRFGNYTTAFFEPKNRVLGLPMWNSDSKQVSDLLVGHEVGHALYTPVDGIDRFRIRFPGIPFDILNIVEDVRIERMIQRAYPGLVYSFREGYRHFVKKDLFKINGVPLQTLCFADRLNIHAKIGNLVDVPLSTQERELYNAAYAAETFDDVLDVCEEMIKMVKNERPKKTPKVPQEKPGKSSEKMPGSSKVSKEEKPSESEGSGAGGDEDADDDSDLKPTANKPQSASDEKKKEKPAENEKSSSDSSSGQGEPDTDSDSQSSGSSQDDKTSGNSKQGDDGDCEFAPDYNPDSNSELTSSSQRSFNDGLKGMQEKVTKYTVNPPSATELMRTVTNVSQVLADRRSGDDYSIVMNDQSMISAYKSFKEKTKKHVSVLVKEFERRKAAFQYSRAQRATTGTIDVNRLHSYKYEDQIFKSVMHLADAKNHGLVFFIDYSGSMARTLHMVIEQTIQLVTFCKAVNIPFEVYGFTTGNSSTDRERRDAALPGYNIALENVNVFEVLNSSVRKNEYETAVRELFAIAYNRRVGYVYYGSHHVLFNNSQCETWGGTPLCETILVAHEIVRRFRAKHNVQRMNVMFLTDGDPCIMHTFNNETDKQFRKNTEIWSEGNEMNFGHTKINWSTRVPKMAYSSLIRSLKRETKSTIIGYFIADNQRAYKSVSIDAIRNVTEKISTWESAAETFKRRSSVARRNGVLDIPGGYGHDMFFAFDSRNALTLEDDDEFESDLDVEDGFSSQSSQNKLAKEFVKYTSDKKTSRVFLNKFSELIA